MKIFLILFLLLINIGKAQADSSKDTLILFSITVFNKKDIKRSTHFPDVFPNIDKLFLISGRDTVSCSYEFPFLKLKKEDFNKINNGSGAILSFLYYYVNNKINDCYSLQVPLKFPFTYKGVIFIVIEHYDKTKFYAMQKLNGTLFTGEEIKAIQIW